MNEINDCIATGAELFDNLELMRWLPVVVCGGTVGNETNGLSLEKETIADDVSRSEDAFDCLGGDGMGGGGGLLERQRAGGV